MIRYLLLPGDTADAFPLNKDEIVDTDKDGVGDTKDSDDDGDGWADATDFKPLDPLEWVDTDGNGVGDCLVFPENAYFLRKEGSEGSFS